MDSVFQSIFVVLFWFICCFCTVLIPKLTAFILCVLIRENEKCRILRQQIKTVVSDLNEISAVNEFAKHARKTRELKRLQDELKAAGASDSVYALKGSLFLQSILYFSLIVAIGFVVRSLYGVPVLMLRTNWFYPLHYFMALPDLTVTNSESPVSCLCTGFLVWCVSRLARPKENVKAKLV